MPYPITPSPAPLTQSKKPRIRTLYGSVLLWVFVDLSCPQTFGMPNEEEDWRASVCTQRARQLGVNINRAYDYLSAQVFPQKKPEEVDQILNAFTREDHTKILEFSKLNRGHFLCHTRPKNPPPLQLRHWDDVEASRDQSPGLSGSVSDGPEIIEGLRKKIKDLNLEQEVCEQRFLSLLDLHLHKRQKNEGKSTSTPLPPPQTMTNPPLRDPASCCVIS